MTELEWHTTHEEVLDGVLHNLAVHGTFSPMLEIPQLKVGRRKSRKRINLRR